MQKEQIQVLILAGGKGTRLQSVVADVPKPMAPIGDTPFLEYQVEFLKKHGFSHIKFLTGYKKEVIEDYFGDGRRFGLNISYSHEKSPLGTGGAIGQAVKGSTFTKFLCLNGDTYFKCDLSEFVGKCNPSGMNIALKQMRDSSRYGSVSIDGQGQVTDFIEKKYQQECLINAGLYYFEEKLSVDLRNYPETAYSLEDELFPKLVIEKKLFGFEQSGDFIDIGIPTDYSFAQEALPQWKSS